MNETKVLVVGCGSIGKRHIGNLQKLGVTEVGAVEVREDRREEVKERFGLAKVYESVDEALRDGYDAVVVGVPTCYHTQTAEKAIEAGAHVLIEKPIADRMDGLNKLVADAKAKRLTLMVGYTYRFWPPLMRIKGILESGALGRVYSVQVVFSEYLPDWHPWEDYRSWFMAKKEQGGGAILDESHALDFVRWLFGEVESVYCINGQFSHLEITADDLAEMILKFKSGAIANVHMDIYGRHHRKEMSVVGGKGNLYWDFYENEVKLYHADQKLWETWKFSNDRNEMFLAQSQHFLKCVDGKAKPPVDGDDGIRTLELILGAIESSDTGKSVLLD